MNRVSLQEANPELAREWHPTKNGSLVPSMFTPGSKQKVWWLCPKNKNHEWPAVILNRSHGAGCPLCAGRPISTGKPKIKVTLDKANPALAKEWHPTLNGSLLPSMVTPGSKQKVWWLCPKNKNHEWPAIILNRSHGAGCPFCVGQAPCKDNCLATLRPDLAKEWHPTKNGDLTPYNVTLGRKQKVWWLCPREKRHEWPAAIRNRIRGDGCPKCQRKISQLELRIYCELKYLFLSTVAQKKISGFECDVYIPEIRAGIEVDGVYWHRDKYLHDKAKAETIRSKDIVLIGVRDAGIERISDPVIFHTPNDSNLAVIKRIVKALDAQCNLDQNKRKAIDEYLQRREFANDSEYKKLWYTLPAPLPGQSLLELRPDLAKEWHPTKNGDLTPSDVSLHSGRNVWWLCPKNKNHEWPAIIAHRSIGGGCPLCLGRHISTGKPKIKVTLDKANPDLAKEWHPTKNGSLLPSMVTPGMKIKVWWLCPKNKNHEWPARILNRSHGAGCPECRNIKRKSTARRR